jgi:hypothetical protein
MTPPDRGKSGPAAMTPASGKRDVDDAPRCEGQPEGEATCDEKINYWMGRWREACEQLEQMRAELRSAEPVLVAADRVREAYEAMIEGRDVGRLPEWERPS